MRYIARGRVGRRRGSEETGDHRGRTETRGFVASALDEWPKLRSISHWSAPGAGRTRVEK
jgi:hypothetical protein